MVIKYNAVNVGSHSRQKCYFKFDKILARMIYGSVIEELKLNSSEGLYCKCDGLSVHGDFIEGIELLKYGKDFSPESAGIWQAFSSSGLGCGLTM